MTFHDCMATAMSIDQVEPPPSCQCPCRELCVEFVSCRTTDASLAASARQQEIFFDYCSLVAAERDNHFLLDERFDSFLDEPHRIFKREILQTLQRLEETQNLTSHDSNPHPHETHNSERSSTLRPLRRFQAFLQEEFGYNGLDEVQRRRLMERSISRSSSVIRNVSYNSSSEDSDSKDPGHVFLCNGSVVDIACDAFCCPATISSHSHAMRGVIFSQWTRKTQQDYPSFWNYMTQQHCRNKQMESTENKYFPLKRYPEFPAAATFRDWPWHDVTDATLPIPIPLLVAGNVEFKEQTFQDADLHLDMLQKTLIDVLRVALRELQEHRPPLCHRERYLIALPAFGTGAGGAIDITGVVVKRILDTLRGFCEEHAVDTVLVLADPATYTLAQQLRYQKRFLYSCFEQLSDPLREQAIRLAKLATSKHLSLFLGAGISIASGLPSWNGMLRLIEDQFTPNGLPEERVLESQYKGDPLKIADELDRMCQGSDRYGLCVPLKTRIQDMFRYPPRHPSLLLYILLSLDGNIVTQNYDRLIERAMKCRNIAVSKKTDLSVIPYHPRRGASRWLLKMHGCVTRPSDIVLTGKDYREYEAGRMRALSGLVQANLLTSHFLFVGYSLKDPTYLRILNECRHALNPDVVASSFDELISPR